MVRRTAIVSLLLLACGCTAASPQEASVGPQDANGVAAKGVNCLTTTRILRTEVRDDQTVDFETTDGRWYRNRLAYSCPGLGTERAFSYRTTIGELCSIDTITVFRTGSGGSPGPSCGLGRFVPIPKPGGSQPK